MLELVPHEAIAIVLGSCRCLNGGMHSVVDSGGGGWGVGGWGVGGGEKPYEPLDNQVYCYTW